MKSLSPVDSIVRKKYSDLLRILLYDNTTNENIFWATDEYEHFGKKYSFNSPILPEMILDERTNPVTARSRKEIKIKKLRIRDMAEVFTPLWVCNRQLNLIDNAWFERENVFNIEKRKTWETNIKKITFPKGKKWKDYIEETRLEIACGEAPYITNRYDVRNGRFIPVKNRIGILDRKLRIVSENTNNQKEWLKAADTSYKNTYAYEWQGDSLFLAREAMLISFIENYNQKFQEDPDLKSIENIAYIVSWNVWQMDGVKGTIPNSCFEKNNETLNLFGEKESKEIPCKGCDEENIQAHNGTYCLIKDWSQKNLKNHKYGKKIKFIKTLKPSKKHV